MSGAPLYTDSAALEVLARTGSTSVTPVMLERLLEYNGFEEKGELPGSPLHRVIVWGHRASQRYPQLTRWNVAITHTAGQASAANAQAVLGALNGFRAWRLRNPTAQV